MKNPCGTTKAKILASKDVNGIPVYLGTGVNPVNSPAQFFVAWGVGVLKNGLIPTFNNESPQEGLLWFIDEDDAEAKFFEVQRNLE